MDHLQINDTFVCIIAKNPLDMCNTFLYIYVIYYYFIYNILLANTFTVW